MPETNTGRSKGMQREQRPLLKVLTAAGLGSRRQLAGAIRNGRIRINGSKVEDFSYPVSPETDTITMDDKPVKIQSMPKITLMLNKPAGVLSTTKDDRGRKTVIDILPPGYDNIGLYPVGRLDMNSTGLLLLTNDGGLAYQLTHPKFEHDKEYLVCIKDKLNRAEKRSIERGIQLDEGMTYPALVKESTGNPPFNYSITIHEGRKRQVRRMFEKLGHRVVALKRIRINRLSLGKLKEGEVRELTAQETGRLLRDSTFHRTH